MSGRIGGYVYSWFNGRLHWHRHVVPKDPRAGAAALPCRFPGRHQGLERASVPDRRIAGRLARRGGEDQITSHPANLQRPPVGGRRGLPATWAALVCSAGRLASRASAETPTSGNSGSNRRWGAAFSSARPEDSPFPAIRHEAAVVMQIQFLPQALPVAGDRLCGDAQAFGDFQVALPFR